MKKAFDDLLIPYFNNYLKLVAHNSFLDALIEGKKNTIQLFTGFTEKEANFSYAEGKWTIKEVLQHLIDVERVFAYRALRFSRNDPSSLSGYDDEKYILKSNAKNREMKDLLAEYEAVRISSFFLFNSFTSEMLNRRGVANDVELSVELLAWLIAGHEVHHCNIVINRYSPLVRE